MEWSPKTIEDRLIAHYLAANPGTLFQEYPVGLSDGSSAARRPMSTERESDMAVQRATGPSGGLIAALVLAGAVLLHTAPLRAQGAPPAAVPDRGVGVVAFELSAFDAEPPMADTLVVRREPASDAPVVARFVFSVPEPFVWGYALEADEPGLESNALEFDYEVQGLPLDVFDGAAEWLRVVYGRAADGAYRHGWVRHVPERMEVRLWDEALREPPLFFAGGDGAVAFHDAPGGARVEIELERRPGAGSAFDYRLEPLEVDGRWMKVRVVTPDGYCVGEEDQERSWTAWIEFLDTRGRPRVWYPTRGC